MTEQGLQIAAARNKSILKLSSKSCEANVSGLQEEQMGRDKVDVAKLLQRHNVIVKGGPEEGRRLMDALVVSLLSVLTDSLLQRRSPEQKIQPIMGLLWYHAVLGRSSCMW